MREFLFLFPELDDIRKEMSSAHLKMLMPDVFDEFGAEALLDVIFTNEWKDYNDILEDPFKVLGFIKIAKKGLKTMTTLPLKLMIQGEKDDWKQIREGMITLKADVDISVKKDVVEYKPDVGIKKLVFVADDEEK